MTTWPRRANQPNCFAKFPFENEEGGVVVRALWVMGEGWGEREGKKEEEGEEEEQEK